MVNLFINPAVVRHQILASDKSQHIAIGLAIVQALQSLEVSSYNANRRYMLLRLLRFSRQLYIARYLR